MNFFSSDDIKKNSTKRVLVYGKAGLGKTSLIKTIEGKKLILDFDFSSIVLDGMTGADLVQFDTTDIILEVEKILKMLPRLQEKNKYDWIILDNVTALMNYWFKARGKTSKNGLMNELQHYNEFQNWFFNFIEKVLCVKTNILITGWEEYTDGLYNIQLREKCINHVLGLMDVVARLTKDENENRFLQLSGSETVTAKNRLNNIKTCKSDEFFKSLD